MTDSEFDELKQRTLQRQRRKTNLIEHEAAIKKLMDLDVSLPVILEWLVGEKQIVTTLPALRRFVNRSFGEAFYEEFTARNGWQKTKPQKTFPSARVGKTPVPIHAGQERGGEAEMSGVTRSVESMLDGKRRDDFTKQYLPINPLISKGK